MRSPAEVMGENRVAGETNSPVSNGRMSPLLVPSPQHSPNSPNRRSMGRPQLSIQELQDLAEKQRKQILYSSKELMDKQQLLMKMHNDFRARIKTQNGVDPSMKNHWPSKERLMPTEKPVETVEPAPASPRMSPRQGKSPPGNKREQDQYAKMLRETYNNMGKLQNRGQVLKEVDIKKLSNVELAHELKKVRAIFSLKQNELAEAVKKVDVLTHELEKRKHGDSGSSSMPTPERINRRKKIQAAKDELDRLRNELIVRNEMNTQQSQQLQLQRDIIHEKQQELRELNSRINELGSALLKQHAAASGRTPVAYPAMNGYQQQRLFNGGYLYDTLNRKRVSAGAVARPSVQDINFVSNKSQEDVKVTQINDGDLSKNTDVNRIPNKIPQNYENTSKAPNQSIFVDAPLTGNQIWNHESGGQVKTDSMNKTSPPLNSPSSSVSSLSSASSTTAPDDYGKIIATLNNKGPPPPPPRTVTTVKSESPPTFDNKPPPLAEKPKLIVPGIKPYSDSMLSSDSDKLSLKYEQYDDAVTSDSHEILLETDETRIKGKPPPPVKPKPNFTHAPEIETEPIEKDLVTHEIGNRIETLMPREEIQSSHVSTEHEWDQNHDDMEGYDSYEENELPQNDKTWPTMENNVPTEPDDFVLSFADIDEINETQTDLWSNSDSTMSNNDSFEDSDFEDISKAVVPVVISVSPDKMPPPILMKPEKPRKDKRNVVLDPFILLLDAALEGEMDTVKSILRKVPDPSRPNPEGITALHNAVCGNHKDVVRYLVEVACDINSADNNGWTPLHCAAFYNDTELCQYLVEHGASVFATTYTDYQTPAHKCRRLEENYDVCFEYLYECKENVGRSENGLVHSLYDYVGEHEDELSFNCGDELTVLRRGDTNEKEWWWARNKIGETGYIPCNLIGNYPRIAAVV